MAQIGRTVTRSTADGARNGCSVFLYNKNPAIVAGLSEGLPMSLEKRTPIVYNRARPASLQKTQSDDNATSIEQEKEVEVRQKKGIGLYYRYSSTVKSRTCVI